MHQRELNCQDFFSLSFFLLFVCLFVCFSVVPKLNCVFTVEIDGFISYIYGSKFRLRSSERSAKKFKTKGTVDL